jgi:hypothetical protein
MCDLVWWTVNLNGSVIMPCRASPRVKTLAKHGTTLVPGQKAIPWVSPWASGRMKNYTIAALVRVILYPRTPSHPSFLFALKKTKASDLIDEGTDEVSCLETFGAVIVGWEHTASHRSLEGSSL